MSRWVLLCTVMFWGTSSFCVEKIYRHSLAGAPVTLDPLILTDAYANRVVGAIYEGLYQYKYLKNPPELKPMLATSMPKVSADGLTLTISIKKNVFFADDPAFPKGEGRELIAEDFVYSMKRHFDPKQISSNRWIWADKIVGLDEWGKSGGDYSKTVEGLRALDRYTLQIRLKKPYPQFLYTLAMGNAVVLPKEAVEYYGKEISIHPVGSGAWKLSSFDSSKAVLIRNPKFRKEIFDPYAEGYDEKVHAASGILKLAGRPFPFVDKIEVYFVEQESARWNSFTKGNEIQYAPVPFLQFDDVVESVEPLKLRKAYAEHYKAVKDIEFGFLYFGFNMEHPEIGLHPDPERNKRNRALRCAIRKAYNWKQFRKNDQHGMGILFPGIIPPYIHGYDETLSQESITLDIEGAKKLLKDHNWNSENLPILRYSGIGNVISKQHFERFKAWMMKIGYPSNKVVFDMSSQFGQYAKDLREKKLMTFFLAWYFDFPDAQNSYQLYYGPHSSPGSNAANYRNPEYDALFEKASLMKSGEEQKRIYKRLNEILMEDCVAISGYTRAYVYLWHKNVIMHPTEFANNHYFNYVAVE